MLALRLARLFAVSPSQLTARGQPLILSAARTHAPPPNSSLSFRNKNKGEWKRLQPARTAAEKGQVRLPLPNPAFFKQGRVGEGAAADAGCRPPPETTLQYPTPPTQPRRKGAAADSPRRTGARKEQRPSDRGDREQAFGKLRTSAAVGQSTAPDYSATPSPLPLRR